jgi:uracil-DNA glycosylase family 4
MTNVRQPDCQACPLAPKAKVFGVGPLTAELLIVAESPGEEEERQGVPLIGTTGRMVDALLQTNGLRRDEVRLENVYQCRATAASVAGKRAWDHCGPSLRAVIDSMPNLRCVVAFGELALQEVSGFRQAERAVRANKAVLKAYERDVRKYGRALVKHERARLRAEKRGKPFADVEPDAPAPLVVLDTTPMGWRGITVFRGSPLRLPYRPDVWLVPVIHPAATLPFRSPRLKPLVGLDFRKAVGFARGERSIPPTPYDVLRTADAVARWLGELRAACPGETPIALDIEWSRLHGELVCIGIGGPCGQYALVELAARQGGWRMPPYERIGAFSALQAAFNDSGWLWGGHFACGYDERKLAELGLALKCAWDTLYGFHLCFAEFGSSRDEQSTGEDSAKFSQATGYDLGFVSSVLTDFPYHKGVVTGLRDALSVETADLRVYCVGDVARTWHSWQVIAREMGERFGAVGVGMRLLQRDMETARRAALMTLAGVPIRDSERQARLRSWQEALVAVLEKARGLVGDQSFNLSSPLQLARVLEARWGIRIRWNAQTGKPKLDGRIVDRLVRENPDNPLLALVGDARRASKEIAAYENLKPDSRGLAHPSWRVHGTVGTRWSSTPNFQALSHEQRQVIG